MSIIKLAAFESGVELEKIARTGSNVWNLLSPKVQNLITDAGLDASDVANHVGNQGAKFTRDAAGHAGAALDYGTGTNATGALGKALAHIKGNKTAYLGAGLIGAGAYGAHRMMNKKK